MGKKVCNDQKAVRKKEEGRKPKYQCAKCGEYVVKEKWVCKPRKI